MDDLKVLVTGVGAPGFPGTLFSLRQGLSERNLEITGTDVNPDNPGRHMCQDFVQIAKAKDPSYLEELIAICEASQIEMIVPQNTMELERLATSRAAFRKVGTEILISDKEAIRTANSKSELMRMAAAIPGAVAEWSSARNQDELMAAVQQLGWPHKPMIIKPSISHGKRGFRIIDETTPKKNDFLEEKEPGVRVSLSTLQGMLSEEFPEMVVMEHLPGREYSVDCYRGAGGELFIPRIRDVIRGGISFTTTTCKHEGIMEICSRISAHMDLRYAFGFQFKEDVEGRPKLLECNPRVQGTMIAATAAGANVIGYAAREAAKMPVHIDRDHIEWNRTLFRYWGALWQSDAGVKRI